MTINHTQYYCPYISTSAVYSKRMLFAIWEVLKDGMWTKPDQFNDDTRPMEKSRKRGSLETGKSHSDLHQKQPIQKQNPP